MRQSCRVATLQVHEQGLWALERAPSAVEAPVEAVDVAPRVVVPQALGRPEQPDAALVGAGDGGGLL